MSPDWSNFPFFFFFYIVICVAVVKRLPVLHHSAYYIFIFFRTIEFILVTLKIECCLSRCR